MGIRHLLRVLLAQEGGGVEQRVDPFERLDAPGKQNTGLGGRYAELCFRFRSGLHPKARQVNARRNHMDLLRVSRVKASELRLLGRRGGDQAIGDHAPGRSRADDDVIEQVGMILRGGRPAGHGEGAQHHGGILQESTAS